MLVTGHECLHMVSDNSNGASRRARGGAAVRANSAAQPAAHEPIDWAALATDELLARYRARPDCALRNVLVERHRDLVEAMARQLASRLPSSVDSQDLVHAGIWGLMHSIDVYDPARCDAFTAFLRIRVRGAMLDELRHMDHLPRLFRRRQREREAALVRLRAALDREPSDAELAAELGIDEAELWRRYGSLAVRLLPAGDEEVGPAIELVADEACESPIEALTRQELLALIRRSLPPLEWKVLQLHYLEGMTGKQVARRMRLSASRICQIHGAVLDRLKTQLAAAAAV
jgi:RNA polymerase sigma factor for flagellar operon FliA